MLIYQRNHPYNYNYHILCNNPLEISRHLPYNSLGITYEGINKSTFTTHYAGIAQLLERILAKDEARS